MLGNVRAPTRKQRPLCISAPVIIMFLKGLEQREHVIAFAIMKRKRKLPVHNFFSYKPIEEEIPVDIPNRDFVGADVHGIVVHRVDVFNVDDIGFAYSHKHIFGQFIVDCFDVHRRNDFLIFGMHYNVVF